MWILVLGDTMVDVEYLIVSGDGKQDRCRRISERGRSFSLLTWRRTNNSCNLLSFFTCYQKCLTDRHDHATTATQMIDERVIPFFADGYAITSEVNLN